ncbi:pilus assembly protein TadG-related protein [Roseivivax sp. CAU 1753]
MSYLGLTTAFVMMAFGGIGVDLMHAELKRTKMQNALDRAVLAAASIENEQDAETVVRDYFRVQNMEEALVGVTPVEDKSYRKVTAGGRQVMPTNFIQLLGFDNLQAEGLATAENGVTNIEIALILDISGSMSGRKIEQLKQAASTFVDNVLGSEATQVSTTVSIVPYNATVNMGTILPDYIALDRQHDYSNCAVFADDAFFSTALDTSVLLEQLGQFDPYSTDSIAGQADRHWCHAGDTASIVVHSSDPAALKSQIATLTAGGNTAIDVGMKWGVALLDPSARGVVGAMAEDGLVNDGHAQRPDAYGTADTQKFIVLMTDGKNTTQYDLKPGLKPSDALTGIFVNTYGTEDLSDDDYSVRVDPIPGASSAAGAGPGDGPYSYFWTRLAGDEDARYQPGIDGLETNPAHVHELSYNDVFHRFGTRVAADLLFERPYADGVMDWDRYQTLLSPYRAIAGGDFADARLSQICGAAKQEGVVVYAIGVEAPEEGRRAMRDCASSASHFFDVEGSDLENTFSGIARNLTQLRLIQ